MRCTLAAMFFFSVLAFEPTGKRPGDEARAEGPSNRVSLAAQAYGVLQTRCHGCHKGPGSLGGRFNTSDFQSLVTPDKTGQKPVVVPKKLDDSELWQRIDAGEMPAAGSAESQKFTKAEKEIIKRWIEQGASEWPATANVRTVRQFIGIPQVLEAIRDDLRRANPSDRPYVRFFILTHLYNQSALRIPNTDLCLYRAALSKAINSLSWKRSIVIPRAVDQGQTIFAIDLRDLDWDWKGAWNRLLAAYPYGLSFQTHDNAVCRQHYAEIVSLSDSPLPFLRADWFVATAMRPPLYGVLLGFPERLADVEGKLGVDVRQDFLRDRLLRSGFARTAVAQANRLVERHETAYGAYWRTYDFRSGENRSRLTEFPLGPAFPENPYDAYAFRHSQSEIVFNLPNGLQAYMVVNAKDQPIEVESIEIGSDARKTSGTAAIVNGISCIGCHSEGMKIDLLDEIRLGTSVEGTAQEKVRRIYPEPSVMAAKLREDKQRFLEAATRAMGPFLNVGGDAERTIDSFDEPIGKIARYYRSDDLDATAATAELGLESVDALTGALQLHSRLRAYGLGPLSQNGFIKRADWERTESNSIMQRTARELRLGTPFREILPSNSISAH